MHEVPLLSHKLKGARDVPEMVQCEPYESHQQKQWSNQVALVVITSTPSEFSAAIVELEPLASAMYTGNGDVSSSQLMML